MKKMYHIQYDIASDDIALERQDEIETSDYVGSWNSFPDSFYAINLFLNILMKLNTI